MADYELLSHFFYSKMAIFLRRRRGKFFDKYLPVVFALVHKPPVLMTTSGVVVCPMYHPTFWVVDVFTVKLNGGVRLEVVNAWC